MNLQPGQVVMDLRLRQPVQVIYLMVIEEVHHGDEILRRVHVATRSLDQNDSRLNVDVFDVSARPCDSARGEFSEVT